MRVWQVGPSRKQIMLLVLLVLEHCWAPARLDPPEMTRSKINSKKLKAKLDALNKVS